MDGPSDFDLGVTAASIPIMFALGAGWLTVAESLGHAGYQMGLAQVTLYYQYGLMVDEGTGWDIYGYEF